MPTDEQLKAMPVGELLRLALRCAAEIQSRPGEIDLPALRAARGRLDLLLVAAEIYNEDLSR